jgi:hypothetical protein
VGAHALTVSLTRNVKAQVTVEVVPEGGTAPPGVTEAEASED